MSEQLTVIIPCLCEEKNVRRTCREVLDLAPEIPMPVSVVLVDDGSTDATWQVMQELAAQHPQVEARRNARNMGLGRTVLSVVNTLPPDRWVSVLPGDRELVCRSLLGFLEVRHQFDLILGYIQNPLIRSVARRAGSFGFTRTVSYVYGFQYRYLNGLKLYRARVFQGIEVVSGGHAFFAELLAKATLRDPEIRVGEAPFIMRGRIAGHSKAFQPTSIARAVREVAVGYRSVSKYREEVIQNPDRHT